MKNWNNNFNEKRVVNGKNITIGQQNFDNGTIMIKEDDGNIVDCPMNFDDNGDCYFIYDLNRRYKCYLLFILYKRKFLNSRVKRHII